MSPSSNTTSIVNTVIATLPGIIAMLKANHASQNPGAPPLTDESVTLALQEAVSSSLAKDDQWLAAHPPTPPAGPTDAGQ